MMKQMISFWKNLRTGVIYKYFGDAKPFNYETEWKQVSGWDYDEALRIASEKYFGKN